MAKLAGLAIGSGKRPESINWFSLDEGPFMPGYLGADYELRNAENGICHEEIQLRLRCDPPEMKAFLGQVNHALRACLQETGTEQAYLRLYSSTLDSYVFARLLEAKCELLPGHLVSKNLGSFVLSVKIKQPAHFVATERQLEIFNTSGTGDSSGLTVYNHDDAQIGHDNWFSVLCSDLNLSAACPLRLAFTVPDGANALGDLHLGSLVLTEPGSMPIMSLEAENGTGGTKIADSQASNGFFQRYTWSGSGWASLGTWSLPSLMVTKLADIHVLPVLRLRDLNLQNGLRLRLLLKQQGQVVYESPVCLARTDRSGQLFAPMKICPGDLPGLSYATDLALCLEGMQNGINATLDLDDILLLPQKRYRNFQSLSGLESKSTLIDDSWRDMNWSMKEGLELKTHLGLGSGQLLFKGIEQRFYVFMSDLTGKSPIGMKLKVKAWYRPVVEWP